MKNKLNKTGIFLFVATIVLSLALVYYFSKDNGITEVISLGIFIGIVCIIGGITKIAMGIDLKEKKIFAGYGNKENLLKMVRQGADDANPDQVRLGLEQLQLGYNINSVEVCDWHESTSGFWMEYGFKTLKHSRNRDGEYLAMSERLYVLALSLDS